MSAAQPHLSLTSPNAVAEDAAIVAICDLLARPRYRFGDEKELQEGIEKVLIKHAIPHKREFHLSRQDRPDFMLEGGVAIEVKIDGGLSDLLRQASRYAGHEEVSAVIVVGTPSWVRRVPPTLCEKPIYAVHLMRSLL